MNLMLFLLHGLEKNFNIVQNVLVFILGRGTLDVTIIGLNKINLMLN